MNTTTYIGWSLDEEGHTHERQLEIPVILDRSHAVDYYGPLPIYPPVKELPPTLLFDARVETRTGRWLVRAALYLCHIARTLDQTVNSELT